MVGCEGVCKQGLLCPCWVVEDTSTSSGATQPSSQEAFLPYFLSSSFLGEFQSRTHRPLWISPILITLPFLFLKTPVILSLMSNQVKTSGKKKSNKPQPSSDYSPLHVIMHQLPCSITNNAHANTSRTCINKCMYPICTYSLIFNLHCM